MEGIKVTYEGNEPPELITQVLTTEYVESMVEQSGLIFTSPKEKVLLVALPIENCHNYSGKTLLIVFGIHFISTVNKESIIELEL